MYSIPQNHRVLDLPQDAIVASEGLGNGIPEPNVSCHPDGDRGESLKEGVVPIPSRELK